MYFSQTPGSDELVVIRVGQKYRERRRRIFEKLEGKWMRQIRTALLTNLLAKPDVVLLIRNITPMMTLTRNVSINVNTAFSSSGFKYYRYLHFLLGRK